MDYDEYNPIIYLKEDELDVGFHSDNEILHFKNEVHD